MARTDPAVLRTQITDLNAQVRTLTADRDTANQTAFTACEERDQLRGQRDEYRAEAIVQRRRAEKFKSVLDDIAGPLESAGTRVRVVLREDAHP